MSADRLIHDDLRGPFTVDSSKQTCTVIALHMLTSSTPAGEFFCHSVHAYRCVAVAVVSPLYSVLASAWLSFFQFFSVITQWPFGCSKGCRGKRMYSSVLTSSLWMSVVACGRLILDCGRPAVMPAATTRRIVCCVAGVNRLLPPTPAHSVCSWPKPASPRAPALPVAAAAAAVGVPAGLLGTCMQRQQQDVCVTCHTTQCSFLHKSLMSSFKPVLHMMSGTTTDKVLSSWSPQVHPTPFAKVKATCTGG